MKILKRLIKQSKVNIAFLLVFVFVFSACRDKKTKTDFIARVDDSYYTQEEFNTAFDSLKVKESFKKEFLRNWVEREVLYKEAVKENIENDAEFKRLLNESKKELAKSFLIQKLLKEEKIEISARDIETYYNENKNDFKLFFDAFLINSIKFNNEDKAIQFRNSAIETGWNKAALAFLNDASKISQNDNQFIYIHQLQLANFSNIVKELNAGEISIVINSDSGSFTVVQLINKYSSNDIPPLTAIKDEVEKRLIAKKKQEFLQNYMKELYSKYEIEIRN
jgi:hypothetical protein